MGNKKLQVWLPLLFSIILIGGMYFGFRLRENTPSSKGFFQTDRKTSLQEIMDLIRLNYVDSVKMDSLQDDAIIEMMSHLDPHSVYIPASNLDEVNEDITGNFEGIGVEFNIFSDTVHVLYVLPGGPSDKAGLETGDKIIKIDNEIIAGKGVSSDEVKKKVRGEGGSKVQLTLLRNGEIKDAVITRSTIPLPALDAAYLIDKNTGYIKLNKFSGTAYEEFMKALEPLTKKGIQKLILDLRGNGGGLMNEAVDIADEFLSEDKLVVYTEGLNSKRRDYKCRRPGLFEKGNLVILVDELSASASEVLAGAIQDWDRGTIIGRRTFGKGLVQEQFSLNDGSAIRLTVARYYTPVGRSIQRSYEKGKKLYMEDIWDRYQNGEMVNADSNKITNGKTYQTIVKKRKVYGGGGIMPDVFVPIDTVSSKPNISKLFLDGPLNIFIYNYYLKEKDRISQFATPAEFISRYDGMEDVWKSLLATTARDSVNILNTLTSGKEYLLKRIKAQLARYKWRTEGYYEALNATDPVVNKAIEEPGK